jgi:isopentenyl diphosphate isomerase/L-lactate dehydrogenase-like FMN-dependent dehydrogenase
MLAMARVAAASPLLPSVLSAQQDPRPLSAHKRTPGLDEMLTAFDFEPVMFANVPLAIYDYTAHGDGSEFTLRRNREAFDWVALAPATAIDPASVDLSCELFGLKLRYPILVAPTAQMVPLHPDGEIGMHRAATEASNTPMIVSHNTSTTIDRIAEGAAGPLWWQLYPSPNLDASREIVDGAMAAGCTALVLTVDQQASYYERTAQDRNLGGRGAGGGRGGAGGRGGVGGRGGAAPPAGPPTGAARYRLQTGRLWYNWRYLDDLRKAVKVPFLLKGILTAEDARLCVEHGVDGIIVSNHGGRSMDYGPSTLEVLPEIVAAVNGRIPVITDSGYRRGTDILKGLALGANAVLLGRATRWALAAFGAPGAQRLLEMMQRELVEAAAAAGRRTMASIDRSVVKQNFT